MIYSECWNKLIEFKWKNLKTILASSYHISIKMIAKSLIFELPRAIARVYYTRYGVIVWRHLC